jgi:hypothetical protein
MWSCFAKRFTKTASAPPIELFVELKQKKKASRVKWSHAKQDHIATYNFVGATWSSAMGPTICMAAVTWCLRPWLADYMPCLLPTHRQVATLVAHLRAPAGRMHEPVKAPAFQRCYVHTVNCTVLYFSQEFHTV